MDDCRPVFDQRIKIVVYGGVRAAKKEHLVRVTIVSGKVGHGGAEVFPLRLRQLGLDGRDTEGEQASNDTGKNKSIEPEYLQSLRRQQQQRGQGDDEIAIEEERPTGNGDGISQQQ